MKEENVQSNHKQEKSKKNVFGNPASNFNPVQAKIWLWRNFIRIHGAINKLINPVSQEIIIDKQ
jgi:hypothetical protein